MKVMKVVPTTKFWNGMMLVKISDVGDNFREWLWGQTIPLVEDDPEPTNWAYIWDWERYVNKQPIID